MGIAVGRGVLTAQSFHNNVVHGILEGKLLVIVNDHVVFQRRDPLLLPLGAVVQQEQRLQLLAELGHLRSGQLLLHCVERGNVLQLPLQRRLAGKAHHQQAEPVTVHQVGALGSAVAVRGFGLEKHLPKIGDIFFDCINVTHNVVVTFFKVVCNLAAGCHRFAVLGR